MMRKDPETLEKMAIVAFGEQYREAFAQALGVNERTVRRWMAGTQPIGDWVWPKLPEICQARSLEILELAQKLPK